MPAAEGADRVPLRVLFILDSMLAPSAMVRAGQYRPILEAREGVRAVFATHRPPAMTRIEAWAQKLGLHGRILKELARISSRLTALREGRILRMARDADVVYVVKVPSLRLYRKLGALRGPGGGPAVFMDLNDGLWLPVHKAAGWEELDRMLELADAVICENRYVLEYAKRTKPRSYVVHDPPQVEAFDRWRGAVRRDPGKVVLGWIGSPSSCDALFAVWEPLERLFAKHPNLHLRIVGGHPGRLPRFEKVRYSLLRAYDQETMVKEALAMDIGLFPLFKVEDALVRGTLKAMVYMSAGAVAAATRVGENTELIRDGVNGVLADSPEEWFEKLDRLILDAPARRRLGDAGLATIRQGFTREKCLESLLESFRLGLAG